jgi:hypothetical protein
MVETTDVVCGDLAYCAWRKASTSSTPGGNCVEVAVSARAFAVRDSKDPEGRSLFSEFRTGSPS